MKPFAQLISKVAGKNMGICCLCLIYAPATVSAVEPQVLPMHFSHATANIFESLPPPSFEIQEELIDSARRLRMQGRYSEAARLYSEFAANNPKSSRLYEARFWFAKCLMSEQKWDEAAKAFTEFLKYHSDQRLYSKQAKEDRLYCWKLRQKRNPDAVTGLKNALKDQDIDIRVQAALALAEDKYAVASAYASGLKGYESGRKGYETGIRKLEESIKRLENSRKAMGEGAYASTRKSLEESKKGLEESLREYEKSIKKYEDGSRDTITKDFGDGIKALEEGLGISRLSEQCALALWKLGVRERPKSGEATALMARMLVVKVKSPDNSFEARVPINFLKGLENILPKEAMDEMAKKGMGDILGTAANAPKGTVLFQFKGDNGKTNVNISID